MRRRSDSSNLTQGCLWKPNRDRAAALGASLPQSAEAERRVCLSPRDAGPGRPAILDRPVTDFQYQLPRTAAVRRHQNDGLPQALVAKPILWPGGAPGSRTAAAVELAQPRRRKPPRRLQRGRVRRTALRGIPWWRLRARPRCGRGRVSVTEPIIRVEDLSK